ncbi:ABC transporter substrate-binding protein [Chloroflexota bacterium]
MKKKFVWVVVSGLMALSLVMASCAPAVVEEEEEVVVEEEVEEEEEVIVEEEEEEEEMAPTAEAPKYGGMLRIPLERNLTYFEALDGGHGAGAFTFCVTNEELWGGDWARGPAGGYGTNETSWTGDLNVWELKSGRIAESWELPTKVEGETATMLWHIRQGIHWARNPASEAANLVGGRELTADDVVFTLNAYITEPRSYLSTRVPELSAAKITSPEPWVVKIEVPWKSFTVALDYFGDLGCNIIPPEVIDKWGTKSMADWKKSVGTGPFILTDFIPGSTATMERNPNYWMKDPVGPGKGNQLPYLDGVKFYIIPDVSTVLAAVRTAKLDWTGKGTAGFGIRITRDDAISLKNTTPELITQRIDLTAVEAAIAFKLDREPFNDIRVRRALMMAIDFATIKKDYYGGDAQIVTFPIPYVKDYADAYFGPNPDTGEWPADCPESVKELYSYNPEKAKALLADAGYAGGLKTHLTLRGNAELIDYFSILVDMWSKVGADVELELLEAGAYGTRRNSKDFDQMMAAINPKAKWVYTASLIYGPGSQNLSGIDDPVINETVPKIRRALITDVEEADRMDKELMKYVLDQAYAIPRVAPYTYSVWWPWIKNYSGEILMGDASHTFFTWVWLDQELKKSMGY